MIYYNYSCWGSHTHLDGTVHGSGKHSPSRRKKTGHTSLMADQSLGTHHQFHVPDLEGHRERGEERRGEERRGEERRGERGSKRGMEMAAMLSKMQFC